MAQERKIEFFLFAGILCFCSFFVLWNLTSMPAFWFDEGLSVEMANNFLHFGKLDVFTAPNIFSGAPYIVGTIGYPMTIPLAGFFAIFGFGLDQARIFMFGWIITVIGSFYFLVRCVFGARLAFIATVLLATFAPFYGNGMMATGEIPGFFFLIWGLFFIVRPHMNSAGELKINYFLAGMFMALASVSKPSIYLFLPAVLFIFLLLEERFKIIWKLFFTVLGTLPIFLVWIWLAFPNQFSMATWQQAALFYLYPYGQDFPVWQHIWGNIAMAFSHHTLIYFGLLFVIIVGWFFIAGDLRPTSRKLSKFFLIYACFAIAYFLKSPGWLRYIAGFQFLTFIFIFPAITFFVAKIFKNGIWAKRVGLVMLVVLLIIQITQLFFFNSASSSVFPEQTSRFINQKLAQSNEYMVGIINAPEIAALVDPARRFHIVKISLGLPAFGQNPLTFPESSLPQFVVTHGESVWTEEYKNILNNKYNIANSFGSYRIYEHQ